MKLDTKGLFISILLLALFLCAVGTALADDKKALTADEIISKHLAAIGGKDAIARIKSRLMLGTVQKENEPAAQMAIISEPGKVSALYRFREYNWRFIYDGSSADSRPALPGQLYVISQKYRDMVSSGLMFNDMSLYNLLYEGQASGARFQAKGMKKLHGRPAYILETRRGKDPMRIYIDAETFMWVRTDYGKVSLNKAQFLSQGGARMAPSDGVTLPANPNAATTHADDDTEIDFYIETSDFRDVDGIKLPFKFEQVATRPILQQKFVGTVTGTVKEYVQNVTVDPKSYQ